LALPLVVTWLLDDHTIGCRRTSIERYAEEAGLAVVMPNAHRSFYCDMAYGGAYWTFLSEELPVRMRKFFPISAAKKEGPGDHIWSYWDAEIQTVIQWLKEQGLGC